MRLPILIFLTFCTALLRTARGDYYTSVVVLEDLLEVELRVVEYLETYLNNMERLNKQIEDTLAIMDEFVHEAEEDPEDYFENPLNAFKIINRLAIDWAQLKNVVFDDTYAREYATNISNIMQAEQFEMPTNEDLQGASKGLARLQRTYAQDTADVAEGDFMEMNFSPPLTASDCYHLGRTLYEVREYEYAAEWLTQARIRLVTELQASNNTYGFPYVTDVQILEYLAPSMYNIGNSKLAQLLNEELLVQDANNRYALENKPLFENGARAERRVTYIDDIQPQTQPAKSVVDELFAKTCRGELTQTPREKRNLRCRYVHNNVPFCFIAPFKKEELNLDPSVAYYHETIYDSEIENILKETEDYIERSKVGDVENSAYSDIRTSQNTWLDTQNTGFLKNVAQRLMDITGLNLDYGEKLQVANYGIGGHYGPHFDFTENPNETFYGAGNRILTALYYINDVELGGGTAFPFLRLLAEPIKRSLVVWYDMHESLELDYRTKHGGCPVLVGSKWICNQWFHERGQEFTRPCGLKPDGYKSIKYRDIQ